MEAANDMASDASIEVPRWFCERCNSRLRLDGRIVIDLGASPLHWTIAHDRCLNAEELALQTNFRDLDAQTWRKLAMWGNHFSEKHWFSKSDWWRLVRRVGGGGSLLG